MRTLTPASPLPSRCTPPLSTRSRRPAPSSPMAPGCAGCADGWTRGRRCSTPCRSSAGSAPCRGRSGAPTSWWPPEPPPSAPGRALRASSRRASCRSRCCSSTAAPSVTPPPHSSSARRRSSTTCATSTPSSTSGAGLSWPTGWAPRRRCSDQRRLSPGRSKAEAGAVPGWTMSTGLDVTAQRGPGSSRTFFGHPMGLANLAGVEMWERFSFYGMQGILVYYLYYSVTEGGLGLPETSATSIVGAYGGLVYLSAIVGAWVADRLFGAEHTLLVAAVVIMVGHLSLALIPGLTGVGVGLLCIALGSGALKTTTSSVLGDLYTREDPRRDAGFSIYYMGVNLGALFGPLLTGLLWNMKGFHWGFGLAALGMAAGLIQYLALRRRTLGDVGH